MKSPPEHATVDREGAAGDPAEPRVLKIAQRANENFQVLSRFVPADLVPDFAAVYSFCRRADDIADDHPPTATARDAALRTLGRWHELVDLAEVGNLGAIHRTAAAPGENPDPDPERDIFAALSRTIARHHLPPDLFHALLDAFEQDQRVQAYEHWSELIDYSRRSANPVGRLVLSLYGYDVANERGADKGVVQMSDAVCTALQLTNFWQDVRRDLDERERVYLPSSEGGFTAPLLRRMIQSPKPEQRAAYCRTIESLVLRTRLLFEEGRPLIELLMPRERPVIWLFGAGGEAVLRKIERMGYATLWHRPKLSTLDKLWLLARAFALRWRGQ